MYVTRVTQDDWESGGDQGREVAGPGIDEIEALIRELDGDRYTLVMLGTDGDAHMAIGGGGEEKPCYVVYATYDNVQFFTLINSDAPADTDKIMLFIGGQEGDYSRKHCVHLQTALRAARTFAENGALDDSLMWERR